VAYTEAYGKIHVRPPTASLISTAVLSSLLGQIAIQAALQFFMFFFVRTQGWYVAPKMATDEANVVCPEGTMLFLLSCFLYLNLSFILSGARPYRKAMVTNWRYMLTFVLLIVAVVVMLFLNNQWLMDRMQFAELALDFKFAIVTIAIMHFTMALFAEWHVFPAFTRLMKRLRGKDMKDKHSPFLK
jgi:cation-transporting ATPase 13A3/4/5